MPTNKKPVKRKLWVTPGRTYPYAAKTPADKNRLVTMSSGARVGGGKWPKSSPFQRITKRKIKQTTVKSRLQPQKTAGYTKRSKTLSKKTFVGSNKPRKAFYPNK